MNYGDYRSYRATPKWDKAFSAASLIEHPDERNIALKDFWANVSIDAIRPLVQFFTHSIDVDTAFWESGLGLEYLSSFVEGFKKELGRDSFLPPNIRTISERQWSLMLDEQVIIRFDQIDSRSLINTWMEKPVEDLLRIWENFAQGNLDSCVNMEYPRLAHSLAKWGCSPEDLLASHRVFSKVACLGPLLDANDRLIQRVLEQLRNLLGFDCANKDVYNTLVDVGRLRNQAYFYDTLYSYSNTFPAISSIKEYSEDIVRTLLNEVRQIKLKELNDEH